MAAVICGCQLWLRHTNYGIYGVRMIHVLLKLELVALILVEEEAEEVTRLGERESTKIFLKIISSLSVTDQ